MENMTLNIPTVSVTEVVDILADLYVSVIKTGRPFFDLPSPFFWGPPGVGKSQGVFQLAKRIEKQTGKKVNVTDVRLLLMNPVDLRGIPTANEDKTLAIWLRPEIFKMDASDDVVNILFLDELSAAPQSVQAAAYQITLDRKIGEHKLPENCIVIAAGNRTTDKSVAFKMPRALANRMMHFEIVPYFDSWHEWAIKNNIDSRIIGYISFNTSSLCEEGESTLAFCTPRSWSFVSEILKTGNYTPESAHKLISACVGSDTAIEFEAWCSVFDKLPKTEEILKGNCKNYPKSNDVLYALISSLSCEIIKRKDVISINELKNAFAYASRFPQDFKASFFKSVCACDELKVRIIAIPELKSWFDY